MGDILDWLKHYAFAHPDEYELYGAAAREIEGLRVTLLLLVEVTMDDLVKELKNYPLHYEAAHRAADHIEKVEEALRQMVKFAEDWGLYDMVGPAREVLGMDSLPLWPGGKDGKSDD
jgi:hypothetical protein